MTPGANLYAIAGASVFVANVEIAFPAIQHRHEDYEFMLPLTQDVPCHVGDSIIMMEKQKFFPFNPWQPHGVAEETRIDKLVCIQCEKRFLQNLAMQAFGLIDVVFTNASFDPGNSLRLLLGLFVDESIARQAGSDLLRAGLMQSMVIELLRQSRSNLQSSEAAGNDQAMIGRAIDFFQEQYMLAVSLEDAAAAADMSMSHFIRAFKATTGMTPHAYLTNLRIAKASEQLRLRESSITEVALACGFSSPGHFSTVFRRIVGVSPSEYRKALL